MKSIKLGGWIFLGVVMGLLIACQPAQDPPPPSAPGEDSQDNGNADSEPTETPAGRGAGTGGGGGHGAGGGGGQGTGGGREGECGDDIVLTLDGEVVWRRTRDELAADPAVGPIGGFRDGTIPGVRLEDLLAGLESMRSVRVSSCGGNGLEVKARQLVHAPLYIQLGGSGRWRLVDLANSESPAIFVRDVKRIEASTREIPDNE